MMPKISVIVHCVVVPIYKDFEELSNGELTSLTQLYKVLGKHHIFFIGPENFDWTKFLSQAEKWNIFPKVKEFDKFYFENIVGYNRLMISIDFLKKFEEFGYILIYQLDAYVFTDELEYWCHKEFDFIGATQMIGVGNGGFSLRNVKTSLNLLTHLRYIDVLEKYKNFNTKGLVPRFFSLLTQLFNAPKRRSEIEFSFTGNEDAFWSTYAPMKIKEFSASSGIINLFYKMLIKPDFRVAKIEEAIPFSFEVNPNLLYKLNQQQLPFGCHAWEKYDPLFWSTFIQINYTLNN
jgi:hypothetical protein